MSRHRKKPVVIEAWQVASREPTPPWLKAAIDKPETAVGSVKPDPYTPDALRIETLEGVMLARASDWIIQGVKGELYPCRNDIFAETYEPAE